MNMLAAFTRNGVSRKAGSRRLAATAVLSAGGFPVLASPPPNYDFDWVSVGDPGNIAASPDDFALLGFEVGTVNHHYRITRTEVTTDQWLEFVHAYTPYHDGPRRDPDFIPTWIYWDGAQYQAQSGTERWPTEASWHYAARFMNWLHNEKGSDRASFETGVYDTSTFGVNPDFSRSDQETHAPGSRYWIPTLDEMIKSAFYDPDRFGAGQEGYWLYPDQGNEPLITGRPEDGGETSHGLMIPGVVPVGGYPHVQSHYGLLDWSGGSSSEWTESVDGSPERHRQIVGSTTGALNTGTEDRLDWIGSVWPTASNNFRVASLVPAPSVIGVGCIGAVTLLRRRRKG